MLNSFNAKNEISNSHTPFSLSQYDYNYYLNVSTKKTYMIIFRNYKIICELLNTGICDLLRKHKAEKRWGLFAFINRIGGNILAIRIIIEIKS